MIISGAGVVSGYGVGLQALHSGLLSAERNFSSLSGFPVCAAPALAGRGSRAAQLALTAAREALAGLGDERMGLIVGGTTGGMPRSETCFLDDAPVTVEIAQQHPVSEAAAVVAETLGVRGPSATIVSACSSGLNAVILARRWVEQGLCDRVLAIGTDALCRLTVSGFAALGAVDAEGARPFQTGRKGITIGEGAAAFVVEKESSDRPVLARLLGSAMIGEAFHPTQPDPSGAGAARAMRNALRDARLASVDAVSAHGTATPQNDAMECKAIAQVLGASVPVSSQKGQLGHTLGAAGAVELAACLLMLREQTMFATYGLTPESVDPACAGVEHVYSARPMRIDTVLKNSFAFGGQDSVVVLGRA